MLRLAGTRARQFSPHAYYLLSDCAFVGRVLDIAGLEPGYHLANELGLRRRYAVLMNASRKRRIERIPIVPRRNARAAAAARCRGAVAFGHMQAVEEPVLPLETLDLAAPDQHIRGGDRDAFRRIATVGFGAPS